MQKIITIAVWGLLVAGMLSANDAVPTKEPIPMLPADYLRVPIVRQATDYSCGAAAASAVIHYWQADDIQETALYEALETHPIHGTEPPKIVELLQQKYGFDVEMRENLTLADLRRYLFERKTVIIDYQAWRSLMELKTPWKDIWDDGHYSIVIGMDDHFVYLMDPSFLNSYTYVTREELLERWHDYEDRHGYVWRYYGLGIIVNGKRPLRNFPGVLTHTD